MHAAVKKAVNKETSLWKSRGLTVNYFYKKKYQIFYSYDVQSAKKTKARGIFLRNDGKSFPWILLDVE